MGNLLCRVQQLDVKSKAKTKDNVCVNVVASIQYRAQGEKANDAFYKPSNTKGQIKACVLSVIKASVPKLLSADVFEQKKYIASVIEEELDKAMSTYGYKIVQKLTVDIKPGVKVKRAKNNARKGQVIFDGLRNSTVRVSTNVHAGTSVKVTGNGRRNIAIGISVNVPAGTSTKVTCNGFRNSAVGISVNVPGASVKVPRHSDTMKEIGASCKSSALFIPGVVLVPYAVTPIQGSSAHMP